MIDAYDVLGLDCGADCDEVKKAYRKLSLQFHPDKVQAAGGSAASASEKFQDIKNAYDILQDVDRKKVYDSFGCDLGEEKPDTEVWNIGVSNLLAPMGSFTLRTLLAWTARWIIGFSMVKWTILLVVGATAVVYQLGLTIRGVNLKGDAEYAAILINVAIAGGLVFVHYIWPLIFDAACVMNLVSEIIGAPMLLSSVKAFAGIGAGCLVLAWLFQNWWSWIIGLEVVLLGVTLFSCTIAWGMMSLYINNAAQHHGEKVKQHRQELRAERRRLTEEVASLKSQLEKCGGGKTRG